MVVEATVLVVDWAGLADGAILAQTVQSLSFPPTSATITLSIKAPDRGKKQGSVFTLISLPIAPTLEPRRLKIHKRIRIYKSIIYVCCHCVIQWGTNHTHLWLRTRTKTHSHNITVLWVYSKCQHYHTDECVCVCSLALFPSWVPYNVLAWIPAWHSRLALMALHATPSVSWTAASRIFSEPSNNTSQHSAQTFIRQGAQKAKEAKLNVS